MTCQELKALLHPYLDGELNAAQRRSVDEHLPGCPDCRHELDELRKLHTMLQSPELRYRASDTLRQRLQGKLRAEAARPARGRWPLWAAAAAVAAIAIAVTWTLIPHGGPAAADDDAMVDAAVDQQQDAVKADRLVALSSTHAAELQTWLGRNLPFAPPVPDLSAQGFTLVGARVDQVKNEPAAVLTYRRGADVVSIFVCPAQHSDSPLDTDSDDGYQVVYWTRGRFSFWVVSKLDAAALKNLGETVHRTA